MNLRDELEKDLSVEKNWRIQLNLELANKNEALQNANNKIKDLLETKNVIWTNYFLHNLVWFLIALF